MLPLGPILGFAARTVATRVASRAAAGAAARTVAGRTLSATQFGRGASALSKVGKLGTLGRGAMLMSVFGGGSSGGSSDGSSPAEFPTNNEPTKKQGLDTYSDGIY